MLGSVSRRGVCVQNPIPTLSLADGNPHQFEAYLSI